MPDVTRVDRHSILNINIQNLMKKQGINIATLAEKAGIAIGTVQKLASDPTCNPTIASLEAICKVFGTSISYLLGQSDHHHGFAGIKIPLIEFDKLEHELTDLNKFKQLNNQECHWTLANTDVSNQSFATKCCGNAMAPVFPEGTTIIFDKEKQHYDGCYVLVHLTDHNKIVFKQLIIDEPCYYIKSINPLLQDNLTSLGEKDKIIATLVQSQNLY